MMKYLVESKACRDNQDRDESDRDNQDRDNQDRENTECKRDYIDKRQSRQRIHRQQKRLHRQETIKTENT